MNRLRGFLRSPRFPIFMIVFVAVLEPGITIPVLPLFAENQLRAAPWQITALTSVYFVVQFFASLRRVGVSDRQPRTGSLIRFPAPC